MAQREIKFHLVQPIEFVALKEGIVKKYPQAAGLAEGAPFDTGQMGYKLTYRYIGTDLVVNIDGGGFFMGRAAGAVKDLVFEIIGTHPLTEC